MSPEASGTFGGSKNFARLGLFLVVFGLYDKFFSQKDECVYVVLNEIYLRNFLWIGVTFRDESNKLSFITIG